MAARWSVALLGGALRARGADGAQTLQGFIVGLENPIDARGEPGGVDRRGASTLAGKSGEISPSGMAACDGAPRAD